MTVTNADNGRTVRLTSAQRLDVILTPDRPGDVWQGPDRSLGVLDLIRFALSAERTAATFYAKGAPAYVGTPTFQPVTKGPLVLQAQTDALCAQQAPACDYTPQTWSLTVYVDYSQNPAVSDSASYRRCDPAAERPASAAGAFEVTEYAGGTVAVVPGRAVTVFRHCAGYLPWTVPTADSGLFRDEASLNDGVIYGHFIAARVKSDATRVDYGPDLQCVDEVYGVRCASYAPPVPFGHVSVRAAPLESGCVDSAVQPSATSVPFGRRVSLTGRATPGATVEVYFRRSYDTPFERRRILTADPTGVYATSYIANDDYAFYAVAGACTATITKATVTPTISGPALVRRGSTVTLTVRSAQFGEVVVYFRRAGETVFRARRGGNPDATGTFTTTYRADADYRYYVRYQRGTARGEAPTVGAYYAEYRYSNVGLTQAR